MLLIFLCLFLTASLMGLELFATRLGEPENGGDFVKRVNFDSLSDSFIMVFVMFLSESWTSWLYLFHL
jgi:hypothetical protein